MTLLLIEPMGLLYGHDAVDAVRHGIAFPLQEGTTAFSLVRLIGEAGQPVVPVGNIPECWQEALQRIVAAPPAIGLPSGPSVMGILNVTPDSFSDGGLHAAAPDAIAAGISMIRAGAAIIDIGGESTRPGAALVDPDQEQARVLPVLSGLRGQGALVSIDTRNASTMRAALDAGADLINDVSALTHDPAAASLLASYDCPVVLMHMRGTPATMAGLAQYDDVAVEVVREIEDRIRDAMRAGIDHSRIVVDPGIGFAKHAAHSLEMLRRLPILANLGCRLLLGTSRKRFIGQVADQARAETRGPGSLVSSLPGLAMPGCILRVHDVPAAVQAMRVWQAVHG